MAQQHLHRGLELRLDALSDRIEALRRAMEHAKGAEKIERIGEIEELKKRRQALADRLRALNQEGPGLRRNIDAEWEKMTDDLTDLIEDFIMQLDADYLGARPAAAKRKR